MTNARFPKILFITPCAFNAATGGGVTFSGLFRGWPKEALATVTGDDVPVSTDVCERYYFLTDEEISFIPPFHRLKKFAARPGNAAAAAAPGTARFPRLKRLARSALGPAGIPDRGRLSPALAAFIREFEPDLVYTILGSPGYADLVLAASEAFDLPVAVHFMDEGTADPRLQGLFGPLLRCLHRRKLAETVERASLLLAIGEKMAGEYQERFGRAFAHFQHAPDLPAPSSPSADPAAPGTPSRFVYVGAVLPYAQSQALLDFVEAALLLNREGFPARLDVYAPSALPFSAERLSGLPMVARHDLPKDDEAFFNVLEEADVLLLPANFDAQSRHFIRLSMPTKVPSFLASGVPILVYGPPDTAQAEDAAGLGWGLVAGKRDPAALAAAMRRMATDMDLRARLSAAALETARNRHDPARVREDFRQALSGAAKSGKPRPAAPPETASALAARLRFVERALAQAHARRILDVGCGTGEQLTGYVAARFPGASVLGVDEDQASLDRARRIFAQTPNLSFAPAVPGNGLYDAVIASEVLEHVDDPHGFLFSLRSRLRPGGLLILTVPNGYGCSEFMSALESLCLISGLLPGLKRLLGRGGGDETGCDTLAASPHVNFFTLKKLRRAFALAGFEETAASGRMFLHNFLCSRVLDASEILCRANARLGARLPLPLVSDWMFALRRTPGPDPAGPPPYRRNLYEKAKGLLSGHGVTAARRRKGGA